MKKKIALIGFIALFFTAHTQEVTPFRFGLKASPNVGWIKPDTKGFKGDGAKLGFNYGLVAEFTLGNSYNYALATGVDINTYGGKLEFADVAQPVDTKFVNTTNSSVYTNRYVEIPLTIKMKTNEVGYNTYFANFGLSTGFRVRSRQDISHKLVTGNLTEENVDVLKDTAPFRLAMILGGGLEYNFHGNTSLLIGFTYNNGFTNLFNRKYYELSPAGNVIIDGNKPVDTIEQKATSHFISLDVGIIF